MKYGQKDGSQRGFKEGGGGRNRTPNCRHPELNEDFLDDEEQGGLF